MSLSTSEDEDYQSDLVRLLELKQVERAGWKRHLSGRVESVADHSHGVALLTWLFCPPSLDRERALEMAILHDLPEILTGDLTPADGVPESEKRNLEAAAMDKLWKAFPRAKLRALELQEEYHRGNSPEARWVKSLDKLEMYLQSLSYESEHQVDLSEFRESASGALAFLAAEGFDADSLVRRQLPEEAIGDHLGNL